PGRWRRLLDRSIAIAHRAAARPYRATAVILAVDLLLIGLFIVAGELVFSDPAELFRELMPGTWLSVAQLAFVAVIAWAIHRELIGGQRPRLNNLWGISVAVFVVFAVDEATQLTIFLADALAAAGALAPAGFKDLDAFLVSVLLIAGGAALLRYGRTLLSYPRALVLLAVGVGLGAASQTLDSVLTATSSEFAAEESLKLAAEPFLIGGYLLILNRLGRP
ncbi:MAG: hypothetical protein ACRDKX_04600, partial [Solirubrobacterales bacterium]